MSRKMGKSAREAFGLRRILFIPAAQPPHKPDRPITSADDRFAMGEEKYNWSVRNNFRIEKTAADMVVPFDRFEALAGDCFVAVPKRVLQTEGQPIHAEFPGKLVVERLLHDRRLRHAEAAEGAGDRSVGVDGAAGRKPPPGVLLRLPQ